MTHIAVYFSPASSPTAARSIAVATQNRTACAMARWAAWLDHSSFLAAYVRFSNRPIEVKRFQTIRRHGVDVARGLALLFGIGTKAFPSWDSRIRRNNLYRGLAVR